MSEPVATSVTLDDIRKMFVDDLAYDPAMVMDYLDKNGTGDSVRVVPRMSQSGGTCMVADIEVLRWRDNYGNYATIGFYTGTVTAYGTLDKHDKEQAKSIIKAALDHAKKG